MASSSVIETGPASTCGRGSWSPSTRWVVAADRQGSERLVLSSTGSAIGSREYDAYGNIHTQTGTSMPFDYTGNRRDAESGLLYLRARLYDPATGRFLSPDPARDCPSTPLTAHAYLYGLANPARYTDPLGLSAWDGPAPSTMPGDYPGAQPYQGIGKPPVPDVDTQPALDDGICSANDPGLCIHPIMDLGLGAKYIPNYDQFVWTHNSPWSWFPKIGCRQLCGIVYGLGASHTCVDIGWAVCIGPILSLAWTIPGLACAGTVDVICGALSAYGGRNGCDAVCSRLESGNDAPGPPSGGGGGGAGFH